ncbi:uncharacterized protein LOC113066661 [Carassius auratus]|uniref:Uncharacterized protein LOC113066661 n=1 Tax=Carassius auratus TaxID=7957 RepID=A0A6P6MCH6_CARAU|nr:uncharacterized protein LOC113066661 [Carassius auratus]
MDFTVMRLAIAQNSDGFRHVLKSSGDNFNLSVLQKGDLILRKSFGPGKKFFHAGIYCGKNEVIQFTCTVPPDQTQISPSSSSSSSCSCSSCQLLTNHQGLVDKISVKKFISGQLFHVYRLNNGPREDLSQRISLAMDDNRDYHLLTNNCLHFALRVLGFSPGPMPESPPQDTGVEISMEETTHLIVVSPRCAPVPVSCVLVPA